MRFRAVIAVPVVVPVIGRVTVMLTPLEIGDSQSVLGCNVFRRDANTSQPIGLKLDNPSETP